MYPILFRIGSFPVNTYGVFLAIAFLCAIFVTVRLAARDGLPKEKIYDLCLWLLLSSLIGSKFLMFFTEPEYRQNPKLLFSLDFLRSGRRVLWRIDRRGPRRSFSDAALEIAVVENRRRMRTRHRAREFFRPARMFFSGMLLGQTRRRCPGGYSLLKQAMKSPAFPLVFICTRHNSTSRSLCWLVFFFLLWLHKKKKFNGQVILAYVVIYATVRFLIEFVRDDPRGDIWGLTTLTGLSTSQLIGLVAGIAALIALIVRWRRAHGLC
jgi:phosphatidylglycerol:prolipoprotein diacylglycerol transferase